MTDPRDQRISELETENAAAKARIVELERKVDELMKVVLSLKEHLDRNSSNSSKPPSSDSPSQKAERQGKGATGGKQGGQLGHKGSKRALVPPAQVTETKPLFPPECENCWAALPQVPSANPQLFQTVELPPLKAHVTQFERHCVACPRCRHQTWASITEIPATPFGPRLSAVIGLFTGVYHLSRRSAVSLVGDVLGIDISLGGLSTIESRVSEAVKTPVDEAWAKLDDAKVKHTDGTSWFQAGVMCSLWTIATSVATVFKILANGQATTLAPLFGKKLGILVSDRATALKFGRWTNGKSAGRTCFGRPSHFLSATGPAAPSGASCSTSSAFSSRTGTSCETAS